VAGIAIAIFEVFTAKLRLFRLPELLAGGFVLAVLGAITALVVR
jgi:formate hydrogenlyase subunit 4